ncbi:MAG: hypothetical protein LW710_08570 [Burkholderiales bacterium]|jgi:hypothetical protein|uniref:hypothetical protein n=1 Tax=Limnobacter sp. TaxID=2003368 RepID=UPI0039BD8984|nr:hypothetical protein [Burkholderiales bacterium]
MSNQDEVLKEILDIATENSTGMISWDTDNGDGTTDNFYEYRFSKEALLITRYWDVGQVHIRFQILEYNGASGLDCWDLTQEWRGVDDWLEKLQNVLWEEREQLLDELKPIQAAPKKRKRL